VFIIQMNTSAPALISFHAALYGSFVRVVRSQGATMKLSNATNDEFGK
jgi:hypothetical protein